VFPCYLRIRTEQEPRKYYQTTGLVANIKKKKLELWNMIIKNEISSENKDFESKPEGRGEVGSLSVKWLQDVDIN
jgi:hypothetical protein